MKFSSSISVVIPVLDDAGVLAQLLDDLQRQQGVTPDVVVVDGGSSDEPQRITRQYDCRLLRTGAGRGRQMNVGAEAASHDLLLFLHADSRLPHRRTLAGAIRQWCDADESTPHRRTAGHFQLRFQCQRDRTRLRYRFLEAKTRYPRPWVFNGDQGLMLHRNFFDELDGFDVSRPFLEDQEIGRKIHRRGRWIVFDEILLTSARRFEKEGFWRRYLLMAMMMGAFAAELDELFERIPDIYPVQSQTSPLNPGDFNAPLYQLLSELELTRRNEVLLKVGELLRENSWQLFLLIDLFADTDTCEWFDEHLAPRLDHPIVDAAAGRAGAALFFAAAAVMSAVTDGPAHRSKPKDTR